MSRIRETKKYTVVLTEQTLAEILLAITEAKHRPGVNNATIASPYSSVEFDVWLETTPNSQESLGYKLTGTGGNAQVRQSEDVEDDRPVR